MWQCENSRVSNRTRLAMNRLMDCSIFATQNSIRFFIVKPSPKPIVKIQVFKVFYFLFLVGVVAVKTSLLIFEI